MQYRQSSNECERVLEAANLAYANKKMIPSLPKNLDHRIFCKLIIVFSASSKVNLLYLVYSTAQRSCFLQLIKQTSLLKDLSRNSDLGYLSISLPIFPLRINLRLHKVSVTSTVIKKFITNLDSYQKHLVLIVFQWWF